MTRDFWIGIGVGGIGFVLLSYICHCRFGLGPWGCQSNDARRITT
jgi:hypothetical protein